MYISNCYCCFYNIARFSNKNYIDFFWSTDKLLRHKPILSYILENNYLV